MSSATSHLESLEPLIPILNAFIHRHKNQHGRSHWFRFVPILRRSIRSLLDQATLNTSLAKGNSRKASKEDAQLQRYAKWLHAKVITRCFLTFSQLAADNQHAPIGLLLLSLLASVNAVLDSIIIPPSPTLLQASIPITEPSSVSTRDSLPISQRPSPSADLQDDDRGTVIDRQYLQPSKTSTSTKKMAKPQAPLQTSIRREKFRSANPAVTSISRTKQTKMDHQSAVGSEEADEDSSIPAFETPGPKAISRVKDKSDTKVKKKKKKKAGDAFADMFGSL